MRKYISIILLLICLTACKHSSSIGEANKVTISCEEIEDKDTFKLSSVASSFTFLPLETNDKSLIGEVSKVDFFNNRIFLLDDRIAMRLLVFSDKGKFLYDIGKRGAGPNEYTMLLDFTIDKENKILYLLCDYNTVLKYSLSGDYLGTVKIDFRAYAIESQHKYLCFMSDIDERGNLVITDTEGKVVREEFSNEEMEDAMTIQVHPFSRSGEKLLFRRNLDNHIYEVSSKGDVETSYYVDFGENSLELDEVKQLPRKQIDQKMSSSRGSIKYWTENNRYAMFVFFDKGNPCMGIYDKQQKEARSYPLGNLSEDLMGFNFPIPEYVSEKDEIVFVINPSEFSEFDKLTETGKKLVKEAGLTEESNPALLFIRTK